MSNVKQIISSGHKAEFVCARRGELIYQIGAFKFSVPIDDMGDGEFLRTDKPIFLMRWVRKALEAQAQ